MSLTHSTPSIITDGLVLCLDAANRRSYPGGSGTVWNDVSINKNHGTLINGPTFSDTNGGSIIFDGSNDYIDCGNSSSVNITGSLTLSSWIYLTNWSNYPGIISKGYSTIGGYSLHIRNDYSLWFEIDQSNGTRVSYQPTNIKIGLNNWYNVVATYNGSTMQIYINANPAGAGLNGSWTIGTISDSVWIGRLPGYGYFQGRISNAKIYNRSLTVAEIRQNFNALRRRFGI